MEASEYLYERFLHDTHHTRNEPTASRPCYDYIQYHDSCDEQSHAKYQSQNASDIKGQLAYAWR